MFCVPSQDHQLFEEQLMHTSQIKLCKELKNGHIKIPADQTFPKDQNHMENLLQLRLYSYNLLKQHERTVVCSPHTVIDWIYVCISVAKYMNLLVLLKLNKSIKSFRYK